MGDEAQVTQLSEASPSVQAHLGILQGVIDRMAGNSASSKAWCVALVSAMLVIVAQKGEARFALLALAPTLLFLALDAYYLSLERRFRKSYQTFVSKVHSGSLKPSDLYAVAPAQVDAKTDIRVLGSFSLWGFYGGLSVIVLLAWGLILQ